MKNRLGRPLKSGDASAIKQALIDFLVDTGTVIDKFKVEVEFLAELVPYLCNFSSWKNIEEEDMVLSNIAIRGLYDCLRNQFQSVNALKRKVADAREEKDQLGGDLPITEPKKDQPFDGDDSEATPPTPQKNAPKNSVKPKDLEVKTKTMAPLQVEHSQIVSGQPKSKPQKLLHSEDRETLEKVQRAQSLYNTVRQKRREAKQAYKEWQKIVASLKLLEDHDVQSEWCKFITF